MRIAVFFVGALDDRGFNASALAGARRAAAQGAAEIAVVAGVPYDQAAIRRRMAEVLAEADGLVFIGGQGNAATPDLAAAHPDKRFAIVQGHRTGPNLASYDVRQEESAFLAGVLAAHLTRTGTVAHLSGHRVTPGLKGRAGFVAGVRHAAPRMPILTGFCGTQDDSSVTRAWAAAQCAAGADILFTMLNAARDGATEACRAAGTRQIGNALDWVAEDPAVFAASALARIDLGVERALADMVAGHMPETVVSFGLAQGDFVGLSMAPDIPDAARRAVAEASAALRDGRIALPESYDGPEFTPEDQTCLPGA
jgi:basic membrane protein A